MGELGIKPHFDLYHTHFVDLNNFNPVNQNYHKCIICFKDSKTVWFLKELAMFLLIALWVAGIYFSEVNSSVSDRKIWSVCDNNSSCSCPSPSHDWVVCSEDTLKFQPCYCMYQDPATDNMSIAGHCMLTCYNLHRGLGTDLYLSIDRLPVGNATQFNEAMCDKLVSGVASHREGRFCGQCAKGYGLAVYSYQYTRCIPCTSSGYKNWIKYFAIALLPLTFFYFLVLLLQINFTSSRLNGTVFAIQCTLSPLQLRIIDGWITALNGGGTNVHESLKHVRNFVSLLGVFNLDFFRGMYSPFCLHSSFRIIHVASLDFIVALYPFVLIFLTYLLVRMYDGRYRLAVLAWKPFKWFVSCYQRQFNVKVSLVHTFATFILLSNVKILGVCFDLLIPTRAYTASGGKLSKYFLYYDATIEYFSPEHLPFAVLALCVSFVFVFLPFLLLVAYPCGCFQRCLDRLGLDSPALHIFMDAFQGSYRTHPRDLRYFSAYYLFARYLLLQLTSIIQSLFFAPVVLFIMVSSILLFAAFQPYKKSSHNKLDIIAIVMMTLVYTAFVSNIISSFLDVTWLHVSQLLGGFLLVLVGLFVTGSVFWTLGQKIFTKVLKYIAKKKKEGKEISRYIESLDRVEPNPQSPLITP